VAYAKTGEFVLQLAIFSHEEVLQRFPSVSVRGISVRIRHPHEVCDRVSGNLIEVHPCKLDVLIRPHHISK
jgi:hypothetical protein